MASAGLSQKIWQIIEKIKEIKPKNVLEVEMQT